MDQPLVLYEVVDRVAVLTLNHPAKRNALSRLMLTSLRDPLKRSAQDSHRVSPHYLSLFAHFCDLSGWRRPAGSI